MGKCNKKSHNNNFFIKHAGFTLIELLVVIGILAILLAVTLIAINPARQFRLARDTQRSSDVNAILNAVSHFSVDEEGQLPGENLYPGGGDMIIGTPRNISSSGANICAQLIPLYIAALPIDPSLATDTLPNVTNCAIAGGYDTGYTIRRDGQRIIVEAPRAELASTIQATR